MLPDVPTSVEQGFANFELDAWVSLFAPAGTPSDAIKRISQALETGLATPETVQKARAAGIEARYQSPEALGKTVKADTEHWSAVIRSAGIVDRKSTRLNSSYSCASRMPSSA